jgi:hypothetical protein
MTWSVENQLLRVRESNPLGIRNAEFHKLAERSFQGDT